MINRGSRGPDNMEPCCSRECCFENKWRRTRGNYPGFRPSCPLILLLSKKQFPPREGVRDRALPGGHGYAKRDMGRRDGVPGHHTSLPVCV
jgi:hypothetical protein